MCKKHILSTVCILLLTTGIVFGAEIEGVVGHWPLDEGSGTIVHDVAGNLADGTLRGSPMWVEGQLQGAMSFNGSSDYVEVPHGPTFETITNQVTLCAWINVDNFINWAGIVGKGTGPGSWNMQVWGDGSLRTAPNYGNPPGSVGRQDINSSAKMATGVWTHAAVTCDGSTIRFYIDGVEDTAGAVNIDVVFGSSTQAMIIGADFPGGDEYFDGTIDDVWVFNRALSTRELADVMAGRTGVLAGLASEPSPADEATDVPRDADLNWTSGEFANTHDVYFGTAFNNVNDADRTNPMGVMAGQNQDANTYDPAVALDFGQTYYWRIDEVNAPPDSTIIKGDLWSFTVEPYAYPIENISATASSANRVEEGPENTINGSGLDDDELHSWDNTAMWLSNITDPDMAWMEFEFDRIYKLYQMLVWNYNSSVEPVVGFGIKEATVEYSVDGSNWTILGTTHEFARGPGAPGYASNTTVDLAGVAAKYVRITANSNWGGIVNQYGLSEVRFLYVPVWAREPDPNSGATDVGVDAILNWRMGREAAKHDVYLSTDEQAVVDGTVPVTTVTEPGYASSLDLASTYYWRIDEVNDAEIPPTWQGDIWNLSTQEYLIVDDFEPYNEIPAEDEGSNLVYLTWIDGFDNPSVNGSTMGYTAAFQPSMEKYILHDGSQSAPLFYDNTTAAYSEVTATLSDLQVGRDWTKGSPETLVLWFYGDAGNAVTEQMYVKVNNVKVVYDGDINNVTRRRWTQWNIDLASLGISLSNVMSLSIGFERTGASGGTGMVLIDDIRLYRVATPIPKPADPGSADLVAYYAMDNNVEDGSGNGNHGTIHGIPQWVDGLIGKALQFDGGTDYVEIADAPVLDITNTITIAAWIKANTFGNWRGFVVKGLENAPYAMQMWGDGSLRFGWNYNSPPGAVGSGLVNSNGKMPLGEWAHLAVTYDGSTLSFYINGGLDTQEADVSLVFGTNDEPLILGCDFPGGDEYFDGAMDDVRVYNRALLPGEVMFLGDLVP